MAVVFEIKETSNTKKAFNIYVRLTLDWNYESWAYFMVLVKYSITCGSRWSQVSAGAITRLKLLEWAKNLDINDDKAN